MTKRGKNLIFLINKTNERKSLRHLLEKSLRAKCGASSGILAYVKKGLKNKKNRVCGFLADSKQGLDNSAES